MGKTAKFVGIFFPEDQSTAIEKQSAFKDKKKWSVNYKTKRCSVKLKNIIYHGTIIAISGKETYTIIVLNIFNPNFHQKIVKKFPKI
jgi:hypothetical protein